MNSFYRRGIKMMHKKMFVMVYLVSTGFLVAADKKEVQDYESFKIVSPEEQLACMMKKGFVNINSRIDSIDLKVTRLAEQVSSLDSKINFYSSLQTASSFEPMGHLRTIKELLVVCGNNTVYSLSAEVDKRKRYRFMSDRFHEDIRELVEALKHDNYSCFSPEFLCMGPEVAPFLRSCLGEAKKIITKRATFWLPKYFLEYGADRDAYVQLAKQKGADYLKDIDDMLVRLGESEALSS